MTNAFDILNSIQESIAVITMEGEIIFTNQAWKSFSAENGGTVALTGATANYFQVCDATQGDEAKMADTAKHGIQQVVKDDLKIFEMEYPCHSPSENRWFILRAKKLLSYPNLTLVAHINITNRKIAELEVEKNYQKSLIINERLHTTLHKIVHDIQNPISGIIGLVDLSKSETDLTILNEYLGLIEEGSNDLSLFVKDTLKHLSTAEKSERINFEEVISNYINSVKQLITSHGIELQYAVDQTGEFSTDHSEFRSILSNLVSNAIKYSDRHKPKRFINIHFTSNVHTGVLKVQDNGIGIREENISKIMNRNFQVKSSKPGIGLGMHMVAKSLINIGGSIKIHSDFGQGSEFVVTIPNQAQ